MIINKYDVCSKLNFVRKILCLNFVAIIGYNFLRCVLKFSYYTFMDNVSCGLFWKTAVGCWTEIRSRQSPFEHIDIVSWMGLVLMWLNMILSVVWLSKFERVFDGFNYTLYTTTSLVTTCILDAYTFQVDFCPHRFHDIRRLHRGSR